VTSLLGDLKHGVRLIREAPGFAAAAVLTLALAIGANTVIFSFVNLLVLQPLPLASPERLGWILFTNPQNAMDRWPASLPEFAAFKDGVGAFESLAGRQERTFTLSEQGTVAERVMASVVVGDLFAVWGLQILQGRGLAAIDERPGSPAVVVLSHRYWVRRFGSAPLIGRSLSLDGRPSTVVGIVSPRIELGDMAEIDIWLPFQGTPALESRADRSWQLTGRLRPDATLAQARAQTAAVAERLEREHPGTNRNWRARVAATREAIAGPNTWVALAVLLTIVGLLLLLACANVTNMLLARLTARRQELAVRVALGATRLRIARQLITEALLLGVAGAGVGLLIGSAGMRLMRAASAEPIFEQVVIDTNVLLFAIGLGLLTPILFSTIPAIGTLNADLRASLADAGMRSIGGRPGRQRAALVVAQIVVAVALLGGASFALQTMMAILHVEPGFTPGGLLTWQLDVPSWKYPDLEEVRRVRERLFDALSRHPGVQGVASVTTLPLIQFETTAPFEIAGRPPAAPEDRPWASTGVASHRYFEVARIPVLRGRSFADSDQAGTEPVAMVSREAARRYWKSDDGADAIGAQVRLVAEGPRSGWSARVIGIVADTANPDIEQGPIPHVYFLDAQYPQRQYSVILRAIDPASLTEEVRRAVYATGPELAVYRLRTVADAIADEQSSNNIVYSLFLAFAAVALLLAATGLYGVMAFSVSRRAPEIAVRMALGASQRDIGWQVVGEGLRLTTLGIGLGLIGAIGLANAMASMLFGVTPGDALPYAIVVVLTLLVVVPALWIPARRAINVDPIQNLKHV
jgi:putative ABC transport system permease protein